MSATAASRREAGLNSVSAASSAGSIVRIVVIVLAALGVGLVVVEGHHPGIGVGGRTRVGEASAAAGVHAVVRLCTAALDKGPSAEGLPISGDAVAANLRRDVVGGRVVVGVTACDARTARGNATVATDALVGVVHHRGVAGGSARAARVAAGVVGVGTTASSGGSAHERDRTIETADVRSDVVRSDLTGGVVEAAARVAEGEGINERLNGRVETASLCIPVVDGSGTAAGLVGGVHGVGATAGSGAATDVLDSSTAALLVVRVVRLISAARSAKVSLRGTNIAVTADVGVLVESRAATAFHDRRTVGGVVDGAVTTDLQLLVEREAIATGRRPHADGGVLGGGGAVDRAANLVVPVDHLVATAEALTDGHTTGRAHDGGSRQAGEIVQSVDTADGSGVVVSGVASVVRDTSLRHVVDSATTASGVSSVNLRNDSRDVVVETGGTANELLRVVGLASTTCGCAERSPRLDGQKTVAGNRNGSSGASLRNRGSVGR